MNKREALKILERTLDECDIKCEGPHIVVLDRGWIFHGNLIPPETDRGEYHLTSCVNIRKWTQNGFGGLTKGAIHAGATLDECNSITFKIKSMIFAVPTDDNWRSK